MSELIVREQRLRSFDNLPPAAAPCAPPAERRAAAGRTTAPYTVERLAARHSRRRGVHEATVLG